MIRSEGILYYVLRVTCYKKNENIHLNYYLFLI